MGMKAGGQNLSRLTGAFHYNKLERPIGLGVNC